MRARRTIPKQRWLAGGGFPSSGADRVVWLRVARLAGARARCYLVARRGDFDRTRAEAAMEIRAGTSGYSYKEWLGSFYPAKLPASEMLSFYAGLLPAVEINNTFYRLPKPSVVESWGAQVPPSFRFAVKASQRITHRKRLKEAAEETAYLLRTIATLGEKLGVLLFQLPPNMRLDRDRLAAFLDLLPEGTKAAFEFRHPSWRDASTADLLRARDFALVVADTDDEPADEIAAVARWGYLRLRRADYDAAAIAAWAERIARQPWSEAFVFFKHEDAGKGAQFAERISTLAAGAI